MKRSWRNREEHACSPTRAEEVESKEKVSKSDQAQASSVPERGKNKMKEPLSKMLNMTRNKICVLACTWVGSTCCYTYSILLGSLTWSRTECLKKGRKVKREKEGREHSCALRIYYEPTEESGGWRISTVTWETVTRRRSWGIHLILLLHYKPRSLPTYIYTVPLSIYVYRIEIYHIHGTYIEGK